MYREPAVSFLTIRDAAIRWAGDEEPMPRSAPKSIPGQQSSESFSLAFRAEPTAPVKVVPDRRNGSYPPSISTGRHPRPPEYVRLKTRKRGRQICYSCRKAGHLARNCPTRTMHWPMTSHSELTGREKYMCDSKHLAYLESKLDTLSKTLAHLVGDRGNSIFEGGGFGRQP